MDNETLIRNAKKNGINPKDYFLETICERCTDKWDDICNGLDCDYCPQYERFLNTLFIKGIKA